VSEPKGGGAAWTVCVPPGPPQARRRSDEGPPPQGKATPVKGDGLGGTGGGSPPCGNEVGGAPETSEGIR